MNLVFIRRFWGFYLVLILFLIWFFLQKTSASSSCENSCPPIVQSQSALNVEELSKWMSIWQDSVQEERAIFPASLAFESVELDNFLGSVNTKTLHITSYHFPYGGAIENWKAHLKGLIKFQRNI